MYPIGGIQNLNIPGSSKGNSQVAIIGNQMDFDQIVSIDLIEA